MLQNVFDPSNGSASIQPGFIGARENGDHLWSIILSGGNGDRISLLIRRWMGRPIPKQYCAFIGSRSMLQHTLARADALVRREHQLTVIAKSHKLDAVPQLTERPPKTIIVQPSNCDTFPGILLPLAHICSRDPDATVVVYPSDHFIYPEADFLKGIGSAIHAAEMLPERIILVGVSADYPESDYGWISPGRELWRDGQYSFRTVRRFLEKPSHARALILRASGCLWNTMVVVAKAQTIWQLGMSNFPEVLRLFEKLRDTINTSAEAAVLDSIYKIMPTCNFSAGLLARASHQLSVMTLNGILWSDWGRVERIAKVLRRIGKKPNFPASLLTMGI
jgi:mannose-1-phosphate guanylyltransferase